MRLVLITKDKDTETTVYSVLDNKVVLAVFHVEKGGVLCDATDVEEMRTSNYDSRA